MRQRMALGIFMVFTFCAAFLTGCNDGSSPTEPLVTGGSGDGMLAESEGRLQIRMVDAPTDEICELHVYIKDLRVKPDGQPQVLLGTEIGDYDLLTLQDGPQAILGDFAVSQGLHQFIEVLLDESRSYVIEKEDPTDPDNQNCLTAPSPLQIPSAKFKVSGGPFEVDSSTTITIDFDAHKSLRKKGGGGKDKGWQLKPDVAIKDVEP